MRIFMAVRIITRCTPRSNRPRHAARATNRKTPRAAQRVQWIGQLGAFRGFRA
jgi:hypothetical protein